MSESDKSGSVNTGKAEVWWQVPYTYVGNKLTFFVWDAKRKAWVMPK